MPVPPTSMPKSRPWSGPPAVMAPVVTAEISRDHVAVDVTRQLVARNGALRVHGPEVIEALVADAGEGMDSQASTTGSRPTA